MSRQGGVGYAHSQSDRVRRRLLAAAGLSNDLLFSNLNTTVSVKSSASRTAPATAALGALSGYLEKRDEQHQWRRRFCVLAPQAFLYYFEDSDADAPRGVIDLEGADVSVGDGNVVHIVTPGNHDTEGRRFYFQANTADNAAAWVSSLVRERYFNVRDERDAYRDLQHDLSAQAAASRNALDEATEEADRAEQRHVAAAQAEADLDDRLRTIARELDEHGDDSEGECLEEDVRSSILARMKRHGLRLMQRVAELEALLESKEASSEERARKLRRHDAEVAELEEELRREETRTQDEEETTKRLDAETQELEREAQEAALNLEVVEQQAKAADARVDELQDQKRLLVREVKNARKALADAEAANRAVLEKALAEAPEVKRDSSEDEAERAPFRDEAPSFVVTCKRCGGDVAGPKNSTCVCPLPLLGEAGPSVADQTSTEAKRVWKSMTTSLFSSSSAPPPPPPPAPEASPEAETPPPAPEASPEAETPPPAAPPGAS